MKILSAFNASPKKRGGFTLIEIVIVASIVALLAALSMILFLAALISANESAAQKGLDTFRTAMEKYRGFNNGVYPPSLAVLTPDYVDSVLAGGVRKGYTYTLSNISANTYTITAAPQQANITGKRSFAVDQSGNISEV
ncbi:MAG: type II secretion system protein [Candidatus Omnitrophica bacterium]|nr:type II secretion system protein [Candidatus Omnitrophota bacterium]